MRLARVPLLVIAALLGAGAARADVLVLRDGRKVDGKVVKEEAGFLWVRTFAPKLEKIAAADVETRTPGESAVERLEALKARAEKDPKSADVQWELYLLYKEHAAEPGFAKEADRALERVLRLAPDHEGAHQARGEVRFEGQWVRPEEIDRLRDEREVRRAKEEWSNRLGVKFEAAGGEHWLLLDTTGEKELKKRAEVMDAAYRKLAEVLGVKTFWEGRGVAISIGAYEDFVRVVDQLQESWKLPQWKIDLAKDPRNVGLRKFEPIPFQVRSIPKGGGAEGMWAALVHNGAHVALWRKSPAGGPPTWLEEGLAGWIEEQVLGGQLSYCIGQQKDTKGGTTDKPRTKKGGPEGLAGKQSLYKEAALQAIQDGTFPEMRKFLRMDIGEYGPAEEGGSLALVTFLVQKDPAKFHELWPMAAARGPKSPAPKPGADDEPWRKTYGWNLIEDMEKEFRVWALASW